MKYHICAPNYTGLRPEYQAKTLHCTYLKTLKFCISTSKHPKWPVKVKKYIKFIVLFAKREGILIIFILKLSPQLQFLVGE